jgi:catechol 2,3-dioxygenase-like lactoylglutathione lyase family enzyme
MINPNLPAGFIGRQFDQIAFVVEDLDSAQQTFRDLYGVDSWSVWEDLAAGQARKTYRGEPEEFQFSCAYGFAGDVLIELCRHDSGRSLYKDWLDTRGPGLHHFAFRLENEAEFEASIEIFGKNGAQFAQGGEIPDIGRWGYFDTVDQIGVYTEVYWSAPSVGEIFERMKRGEIISLADLQQQ